MTLTSPKSVLPPIFLVDDDEDDQFLLQRLFKQHFPHYPLKPLSNGLELIDALETTAPRPALVLLDLNMPVMNGFEALEQIRQQSDFQSLPVIVLTTSSEPRDRQRAQQLGANGFQTKPLHLSSYNQLVLQLGKDWLHSRFD